MDTSSQTTHDHAELVRLLGDVLTDDQDKVRAVAQAVLGAGFRRGLPGQRVREVLRGHQVVPGTDRRFCACGQRLGAGDGLLEHQAQLITAPSGDDGLRPGERLTGQDRINGGTVSGRFVEIAGIEGNALVHTDAGPRLIAHGTWQRVDDEEQDR